MAMTDLLDQALTPSPDAFFVAVGDETVLLQVRRSIYYGLNPVGTRLWESLNAGHTGRQASAAIARDYDVASTTIEEDARSFLSDLVDQELVVGG